MLLGEKKNNTQTAASVSAGGRYIRKQLSIQSSTNQMLNHLTPQY